MTRVQKDPAVEALYDDYCDLKQELQKSPSGLAALNRSYHKQLLLASASSLEDKVKELVTQIFERNGNPVLATFVRSRVMARNYHTLFDWSNRSANAFFASFGADCRGRFTTKIRDEVGLKEQSEAFLTLGDLRNSLVHNNYAVALVDLTPLEIIEKYRLAIQFVGQIESIIVPPPASSDIETERTP